MGIADRLNREFKIVLASASPRRKQLLELAGLEFDIWPSNREESVTASEPEKICTGLSREKALDVASQIKTYNELHDDLVTQTDILVIGADTIVVRDRAVLGKPKDEDEARMMLHSLSGKVHSVFTGVTLVFMSKDGRVGEKTFFEETKVTFYPLDDDDIDGYIATGEPLDKAGAYGIQGKAAVFVKSIEGDYCNVVGLPVARILHELAYVINDGTC